MKTIFRMNHGLLWLVGLAILTVSWGCDKEPIKIESEYSFSGGVGTDFDRGAVEFRIKIPSFFRDSEDYLEVVLYDDFDEQVRRIYDAGDQVVNFHNLEPGFYDYEIVDFDYSSGLSSGNGFYYNSQSGYSSYSNFYNSPTLDRDNLFGTVEVLPDETVIIEIKL